ncbi:potassium channel family protein [Marinobacter sp.]|uniref:potassium channel family protein n=1 Tax=Marinobacter sp. TaxID=50741 RepID=UPI00384FA02F
MIEKQQFIVIGLGVFGATIARELTRLGHDVLGVDSNEAKVDDLAEEITHAVIADVTRENALKDLDAGSYDVGIVAVGHNAEAAILATMYLRDLGVEEVWSEARSRQYARILERMGATRVITPESELGIMVAEELNYPMVNNFITLGDDEIVVEIIVSENLDGVAVSELLSDDPTESAFLLVKRGSKTHLKPPDSFRLKVDDRAIVAGPLSELRRLADRI